MDDREVESLTRTLAKRFRQKPADESFSWSSPALNMLDCVLSLNRQYDNFCYPRVERFALHRPNVKTLAQLLQLIRRYPSPLAFSLGELDYNDAQRAQTLVGVVRYLLRAQKAFTATSEASRLRQWAASVTPEDLPSVQVRAFALAGFQYLRMLFGVQTTKPDIHIRRYIGNVLGRVVSDVEALMLLEEAAGRLRLPLRSVDYAIWKKRDLKRGKRCVPAGMV